MENKNSEFGLMPVDEIPYPALRGTDSGDDESPLATLLGASDTLERDMMPATEFPTGGTPYWNFKDGSQPVAELSGVIVHQHDRRGFWPASADKGERPFCISVDGESGYCRDDSVAQTYGITGDCMTCPMSQFGTAVNDRGELTGGQACTLRKDLYLATEDHHIPLLVSVPSTSVRTVKKFLIGQAARGRHFWTYETVIGLETNENRQGDRYSIAKPMFVKALEPHVANAARLARDTWIGIIRRQNDQEVAQIVAERDLNLAGGDDKFV